MTLSSSGTEGSGGGYYRILDFAVDNLGKRKIWNLCLERVGNGFHRYLVESSNKAC